MENQKEFAVGCQGRRSRLYTLDKRRSKFLRLIPYCYPHKLNRPRIYPRFAWVLTLEKSEIFLFLSFYLFV